MRLTTANIVVAMVAILTGCVPSLHPLYTESDIVFDQALVGDWYEEGEDEIWTFEKGDGGGYYLTITEIEDDEVLKFKAFLFELDGRQFIDFYADPPELSGTSYEDLMLPMHWFGTIEIKGDLFEIAVMDGEELLSMIESGTNAPSNVDMDNYLLLTAPTEDLQKFVLDHIDDGIFSVDGRMIRK